ncbi:MAG: YdcF family protein [Deltaproteobacteria bacterium]|nr:MAG: YdcF family protein [Deltaproteobacteria bacterium]
MSDDLENMDRYDHQADAFQDSTPIEPERKKMGRVGLLKWLFFLLALLYVLFSYYHTPILTHLGRYLIVEHPPQKSDLIVCLAGGNVDRGLAVADAYQKGLAPRIFMAREVPPDGYALLKERGVDYPESVDLMVNLLERLGIPRSAFLTSERSSKSTFDEATLVRELVMKSDYHSLLIITTPYHCRRTWLTFRKVLEKDDVRILMLPSPYSDFKPSDWWKKRRYLREVIIEYQKLIYYTLKYLW